MAKSSKTSKLVALFQEQRCSTAKSILDFRFNKKRVRVLSNVTNVKENSNGILYWMFRDQRVEDNWAFLFAQKLALKNHVPLHVCFVILPKFLDANMRHYKFLAKSLEEVAHDCTQLNINFHLLLGNSDIEIPKLVKKYNFGGLVCDLSPLRMPMKWVETIKNTLPDDIPFCQVDAHNIVPVWVASDKQEYAARTIRTKINKHLGEFLTDFPPLVVHEFDAIIKVSKIDWNNWKKHVEIDELKECSWIVPGYRGAVQELENFCEKRLKHFATKRNNPLEDVLSNLSPWYHFGQLSVQRVVLEVQKYKNKYKESVDAYCEEAIIRRELSDNFCFYNENYDSFEGLPSWAIISLNLHKKDKRQYVYELETFEKARTHDDLWNSAQIQLTSEGKMHGFLRMYWAKKILEWTVSPEEALKFSIYLNDKYSLDGRDPNGYVGCMWSIGGVHDQGWKERPVFGKIRYMNYEGCKRKFDVAAFVARYGGKSY